MASKKSNNSNYYVIYSKMGKIIKESFPTLAKAKIDYEQKLKLDKLGYFDDRFVIGIEDNFGVKVDVSLPDYKERPRNKPRSLAVITARGGSKRIPQKNLKYFCGKPIIAYSIEKAISSELFDEVMVSTDDHNIALIAKSYGAKVPFFRSAETASDYAGLSEVLEEVKNEYHTRGGNFDFICCILPTAPFITISNLRKGFELLLEKDADVALPIVRFSYPFQRAFRISGGRLEMFYPDFLRSRSQDLEPAYHDSGQFYWMKFDKSLESADKVGFEIPEMQAQDIDTEDDWYVAELKYKLMNENTAKSEISENT